jgi:Ran GTPase-activating protein (RanGAP) involved in mRNA processing and transport
MIMAVQEMAQLVGSLYEHPSMSEVNVSDNILGPESCHRLANALASPKVW